MRIWIDADACPRAIKDILYRAGARTQTELILVANRSMRVPESPLISTIRVEKRFDAADTKILEQIAAGDLVVTGDVPLAAEVIGKGASALNPRGEWFDPETIGERLNMRDFVETLRGAGIHSRGPSALGAKHRQAFADNLDAFLARSARGG